MKNINYSLKCCFLLFSVLLTTATVYAVIFAPDFFNFYLDGEIVKNGPFIIKNGAGYLELHDKTAYSMRQNSSQPGTYTFSLLKTEDVTDYESWAKDQKDLPFSEMAKAYQAYLQAAAEKATASATVYIPSPSEMPALEKASQIAPAPGMTGGKIGHDRFFKVILNKNVLEQIKRQEYIFR